MKYIIIVLFCVLSIITKTSYADNTQLPHLYTLHINGINTTKKQAIKNLDNLNLFSKLENTNKYLSWNIVYNPTANQATESATLVAGINLLDNILDVLHQKNNEVSLKN